MFADKLREYVLFDSKRRLRDDRLSLLIAFLAYCLFSFVWNLPEDAAAKGSLGVLAVSMLVFTLRYCISDAPA